MRSTGSPQSEERPPVGLEALPQTVLPDIYGRTQRGHVRIARGNRLESSAAAYTGLLATLLVAPLAWTQRRQRSRNVAWLIVIALAMSWTLNVPGLVWLWRRPGLNMLSYNRFVFVAAFAILSMAAVGLDALWHGRIRRRWWFAAPAVLAICLGAWCLYRSVVLPEPLATEWAGMINQGRALRGLDTIDKLDTVRASFMGSYLLGAGLCALAAAGWTVIWFGARPYAPVLAALLVAELLVYAHDVNPQCDPRLYYPPIPLLQTVAAQEPPGRIVGMACLPARIAEANGLRDVRGYDGVDPTRLMQLMFMAADPQTPRIPYALTQWYVPKMAPASAGTVRLHPVLDMLNVRHVIFRGNPPPAVRPWLTGDDYWVLKNPNALPRLFVPARVEVLDTKTRLARLGEVAFDASEVAFVEDSLDLPERCQGSAVIEDETPGRLIVEARMETPGLLVMADMWDPGWTASVNGLAAPVLRTNHVLRGVVLPAGSSRVTFEYDPSGFRTGARLMFLSLVILASWLTLGTARTSGRVTR